MAMYRRLLELSETDPETSPESFHIPALGRRHRKHRGRPDARLRNSPLSGISASAVTSLRADGRCRPSPLGAALTLPSALPRGSGVTTLHAWT